MNPAISAVVVMGVAGCGKTSVARALAQRVGGHYIEGDAFHPEANVEKMSRGFALTDADRAGWLDSLATELLRVAALGERPVLACSALKRRYRERFGDDPGTPAVQTYDAMMVGAEALKRAGKQPMRDVLAVPGGRWPGLEGEIVLDAFGDTQRPLHMTEVRDGRFQALIP